MVGSLADAVCPSLGSGSYPAEYPATVNLYFLHKKIALFEALTFVLGLPVGYG
jgi:hypothetical protein